jgi:hypothetical protein
MDVPIPEPPSYSQSSRQDRHDLTSWDRFLPSFLLMANGKECENRSRKSPPGENKKIALNIAGWSWWSFAAYGLCKGSTCCRAAS